MTPGKVVQAYQALLSASDATFFRTASSSITEHGHLSLARHQSHRQQLQKQGITFVLACVLAKGTRLTLVSSRSTVTCLQATITGSLCCELVQWLRSWDGHAAAMAVRQEVVASGAPSCPNVWVSSACEDGAHKHIVVQTVCLTAVA